MVVLGLPAFALTQLPEDFVMLWEKSGKMEYVDVHGEPVFPGKTFKKARNFHEGRAAVGGKRGWGFIDPRGEVVVDMVYGEVDDFHEGIAMVEEGPDYRYIGLNGRPRFTNRYGKATRFWDGIARVKMEGKHYLLHKNGRHVALDFREVGGYMSSKDHYDNRIMVEEWAGCGYTDEKGDLVIPCQYWTCGYFRFGKATAQLDEKTGIIDVEGNWILPPVLPFSLEGEFQTPDLFFGTFRGFRDTSRFEMVMNVEGDRILFVEDWQFRYVEAGHILARPKEGPERHFRIYDTKGSLVREVLDGDFFKSCGAYYIMQEGKTSYKLYDWSGKVHFDFGKHKPVDCFCDLEEQKKWD
ncbi:MAG: WG repeat-containing protein [Bacteroidota bacterium]